MHDTLIFRVADFAFRRSRFSVCEQEVQEEMIPLAEAERICAESSVLPFLQSGKQVHT